MDAENQTVEFKSKVDNFHDISKTSCAFANANGGRILVGVSNSGETVGITVDSLDTLQQRLEGKTLQDFMVKRHIMNFDEMTNPTVTLEDIDGERFKEYFTKRSPNVVFDPSKLEEYLINLSLAAKNGSLKISNTALLFFSKEPSRFVPQSEIKMVRFKGTQSDEILDSRYVNENVIKN